ncbi:MAG: ABC transporter substrate-binding protein [Thermoplasmatota archaeon]
MKWKKLVSLLIVSVFVFSALAVVNSPAEAQEEGEFIDSITIEVRTSQQTALGEVATRDLDVFLQTVPGATYDELSDSWKAEMDTYRSIGSYNNMYYNPAHTESPYEVEIEDELQFNPFAIKEVRQAQNFLIDRGMIVDEIFDGYGEARYLWMAQSGPGYEEYFAEIVDELGYTRSGDEEKGYEMIQTAMEDARDDDDLEGELREEGGNWQYRPPGGSWDDIEITGITRSDESEREEIGEYQTRLLEDAGFEVDNRKMDRTSYSEIVFSSPPENLEWQFYTGGWLASAAQYYQEVVPAQMHSGWYGYMPGGWVPTADYRYGYYSDGTSWDGEPEEGAEFYGNESLAPLTNDLYNGWVNDLDEYWSGMQEATKMGADEAVRVFVSSTYDFYAYDKDEIVTAATDVVTGWSDFFTPRTMKTQDGELTGAQYSSQGALYMDNWNEIGGSSDVYGLMQKRMAFDDSYNLDPSNGRPISNRFQWEDEDVELDFQWTGEDADKELHNNISVPEDAMTYDHANKTWTTVGENVSSAVKATYDIETGAWHTGEDLSVADIIGYRAWMWDMTYDDGEGDNLYNGELASSSKPYFDVLKGEEWDEENETVTIYSDYTLPVKSKVGSYLSYYTMPQLHYSQYMATQYLINENEEYIPSGTGSYSWDEQADHWVHWLSENQGEDITDTLQNMIDADWEPEFMTNAPADYDENLEAKMQGIIDFYDDHEHVYASQGPFIIDTVNAENMYVDFVRFTEEDGYPFPKDYWQDKFYIAKLDVTSSDVPSFVQSPDELEVSFDVQVDEDYPQDVTRDVTGDDDATGVIEIIDEVGSVVKSTDATLVASTFTGTFNTSDLAPGEYTVRFSGAIESQVDTSTGEGTVIVQAEPSDVEVSNFEADPSTVGPGEDVTISASLTNNGGESETVDLVIGGETVESYVLDAGESMDIEETTSFDSPGTYQINLAGETIEVQVISTDLVVDEFNVPSNAVVDKEVTITATVRNDGNTELEDSIYVDGEGVESFTLDGGEEKELTVEHTFDSTGSHEVSVGSQTQTINIQEAIVIESAKVDDNEVKEGDDVEITATITNNDDTSHDVEVKVGGETVHTWSVDAEASNEEFTYTHTFEDEGDFEVTVGEESVDTVEVESKGDGGGIPGFTMALLGISAVAAIALYHRRRK